MLTTINHACGHKSEQQMYGPGKDRERRSAWLATQDCPACSSAARQAESAVLVQRAESSGLLPDLAGSEKQIAWARTIRAGAIEIGQGIIAELEAKSAVAEANAWAIAILRELPAQSSAAWWIEHRDSFANRKQFLEYLREQKGK